MINIYVLKLVSAEMLRHIGENAKKFLYNPRYVHTYVDEDVIGQWKRLCVGMPRLLGRTIALLLNRILGLLPKASAYSP